MQRPNCIMCEKNIPFFDIFTQFQYTRVYGGKKYNKPQERVWTCKKCRIGIHKYIDEIAPLIKSVFGDK